MDKNSKSKLLISEKPKKVYYKKQPNQHLEFLYSEQLQLTRVLEQLNELTTGIRGYLNVLQVEELELFSRIKANSESLVAESKKNDQPNEENSLESKSIGKPNEQNLDLTVPLDNNTDEEVDSEESG